MASFISRRTAVKSLNESGLITVSFGNGLWGAEQIACNFIRARLIRLPPPPYWSPVETAGGVCRSAPAGSNSQGRPPCGGHKGGVTARVSVAFCVCSLERPTKAIGSPINVIAVQYGSRSMRGSPC